VKVNETTFDKCVNGGIHIKFIEEGHINEQRKIYMYKNVFETSMANAICLEGNKTLNSNLIITIFTTTDIANNQESIIETLKVAPIYTFILTVFVAPILEELVFRLSFRKIFPHSNKLFIFFSGLIFGGMHVIGTSEHLVDLLFIIPYSLPGFIFAYVYTKSKNIFVPISLHFIHNGIMMSLQILLLILK
jgi:membrane protease YdiL (CAAX protease family)